MTIHRVHLADVRDTPWRNGGGRTRELLAWPGPHGEWLVRVSVAEIDADGPFSSFPGVERCFAVLDGAGVILSLPNGTARVTAHDDALCFAGEAQPHCRLIDGPTRDLNLMVRRRAGRASMQRTATPAGRWRGFFDGGTLHWTDHPGATLPAGPGWRLALG